MSSPANLPKKEMLRYTGMTSQVAGIRKIQFVDGMARGIPAVEVKTGSGLEFTVLSGRNMDLYNMNYKGINLAFYYKNGLIAPERAMHVDGEYLGQGCGGMMYTSGLQNSGPPNTDEGLYQPLHGRIGVMGAENTYEIAEYDDNDELVIQLGGRTRESRLFAHNLTLSRKITTSLNSNSITIDDVIENETCRDTLYSIMYHMNFGYPFLDACTQVYLPKASESSARTDASKKYFEERFQMTDPIDNFEENLYFHDVPMDSEGLCHALIVNKKSELGVHLAFTKSTLPYLAEWKSMGSGDYALGIMPSNTVLRGRNEERAAHALATVSAFSKAKTQLTFTVLDGKEEISLIKKTYID